MMPSSTKPHNESITLRLGITASLKRQVLNSYWLIVIVVAFAGTMELGQLLVPTRNASFENFSASALGAVIGILFLSRAMHLFHKTIRGRNQSDIIPTCVDQNPCAQSLSPRNMIVQG